MKNWMIAGFLAGGLVAVYGCSSSSSDDHSHDGPAGAVSGALDSHCGSKVVKVDQAACTGSTSQPLTTKTLHPTHEETDAGDGSTDEYGATLFNAEGDDDECKFHVKWTSTAITENADVSFTVTATNKSDGSPVTPQNPIRLEVFLDDTHPGPNTNQTSKEGAPGVYTAGPIRFDKAGRWTVRFHFNEQCEDGETSPHGHAAFYVQVP